MKKVINEAELAFALAEKASLYTLEDEPTCSSKNH